MVADLAACKAKCESTEKCAHIEYGWKDSKWCTLLPKGTDCSKLASGSKDCGSGGGDNGVHTYTNLAAGPEAEEESKTNSTNESEKDFVDAGAGCCAQRDPANMLFKGMVADLQACKAKCLANEKCENIEYGWKDSKWCTLIPQGVDCSNLTAGAKDCGSGGGDNGVHTYALLAVEPPDDEQEAPFAAEDEISEQCESFSLDENEFVRTSQTEVPGAIATSVQNAFVSAAGVMNGAYVNGAGKRISAVRRKKNTRNQYLLGIYDRPYAKMVEITLGLKNGVITAAATSARYKNINEVAAKKAYSTSDKMTQLWAISTGQRVAMSDRAAGYGIKGLQVKSCLVDEDAVKAGETMDTLIDDFIDAQAGSEDACHSQFMEARHQLNQLHALVSDLAHQVNATEEQIMVYDKMLEDKLQDLRDLMQWKKDELKKCETEKTKAIQMFGKLKLELEEMKSIANPSVAMDVKNGKLHQVSFAQMGAGHLTATIDAAGQEYESHVMELSTLQKELAASLIAIPSGQKNAAKPVSDKDMHKVSALVADTQSASLAFLKCMSNVALLAISHEGPKKTDAECQAEQEALKNTYVKAYVELSRLKAEYEDLANSSACVDTVMEEFNNRKVPLQQQANKLATSINEEVKNLQSLRPRLDAAIRAETKLKKRVDDLSKQCDNLGPTISDLKKVRDAISALSSCPGLSRVQFFLPKWVGTWASFYQNGKADSDADQDKLMNAECQKISPGSRPAEVDEIQEQTVQGIPTMNTASSPLLGACPDCNGVEDKSFQSGHSRVCWAPDTALDFGSRQVNCGTGKKAILCVLDQGDIREIPGQGNETEAEKMAAVQMAAIQS
eukprot:gnl/MRDRNA2_/MRDRNA2_110210_c0_seq1.p1 gnl/MRDRNA2_/MRDRNA2_110210_c0~~gnl/MRDRNA2_/MRDRNA2_110210_c0_seq1.p1  ORF type:complete len:898 (-),score=221.67 gnl/MRDRNA2_/MRDRNA2_110210_c0_seq1:142-2667(-)